MDNKQFDITYEGKETLITLFSVLASGYGNIVGYRVSAEKGLIFYWTHSGHMTPLPYPMTPQQAAEFAWGWLEHADYGPEPDHDGNNGHGWRLYCEQWGHVDGQWEAAIAIQPVWACYGK